MMKRLFAMMLSIVMVISMVPVPAFAQEEAPEETQASTEIAEETQAPAQPVIPAETEVPASEETTATEETEAQAPAETTVPTETESTVPAETTVPAEDPEETTPEMMQTIPAAEELSVMTSAEADPVVSGTCGTGLTWNLSSSGVLTISGSGRMTNYGSGTAPWFPERLSIKSIVIESGVTGIGNYAFYYCVNAVTVSIPDTVQSIGYDAFAQCAALKSVEIPYGVKYISSSLFYNCTSLTKVTVPESVTYIESNAFENCTNLVDVTIPSGVTSLGNDVFQNCASLKVAVIPNGIKTIGYDLFSGCTSLESVTLPDSLTSIYSSAFSGCAKLKEISIPAGVTSIESSAFQGCTSLTAVTLPKGLPDISSSLFSGCTGLKEIEIPKGVLNIGSNAFNNCTSLSKVTMSEGVLNIGSSAFSGCTGLTEIRLPDSIQTIYNSAFFGCTALQSVEIPGNVTSIGDSAFRSCTALQSVEIPDSVTSIGSYAFYSCTGLGTITIPGSVEKINSYTFEGCTGLRYVDLREGVTGIQYEAFRGCTALYSVYIPSTVATIGEGSFRDCTNLKMIMFGHLSSAVLSIYSDAFYLSNSNNYKDVATTVYVPYARDIHSAISGYPWAEHGREVTYVSSGRLPAEIIDINPHPEEVEAGLEVAFTAVMDPWYSTSDLIWEVKNGPGKATIDENGVLVGTQPGYVTVICKSSDDDSVRDESQIRILKATATVESIDIRCGGEFEAEVELDEKVQMIATVSPGNAANKAVTWEVENGSGSATITDSGVLTGTGCGTVTVFAMAKDGSEVIGSRVIEVLRYVTDIAICINGQEGVSQVGVSETAALSAKVTPDNASYPKVTWTVENGTGEAKLNDGFLQGISAGTVTLTATSQDSRKLAVTREIQIVGEQASFAVTGGKLYYNTVTGTILDCDNTVSSANIPAIISGTRITAIAPNAFYNLDSLTSVTIPSSVTHIGNNAFYDCDNLTSLRFLGNGLKSIGKSAFCYCAKLVNLTIPDSVVSLGESAFYGLNSLKNLTISGELDTRGWLQYSNTLDSVTFTGTKIIPRPVHWYGPDSSSVESMPGRNAKKVIVRNTVTEIGDYAFHGIDYLEEVTIGSGVVSIGKYAFNWCDALTTVTMGDNVKTIGDNAFENCNVLTTITLGAGVKTVGNQAFRRCPQLTEVVLPEGIETLGEGAFANCASLEKLNLPGSLKHIGKDCFGRYSNTVRLQLIDLSCNPAEMSGSQMQLTYNIPTVLVKGTSNQNRIRWQLLHTEENPSPYEIAGLDNNGLLWAHGTGTVTVLCEDDYTGACGTWDIEISTGVMIVSETGQDMVVSGNTLQLLALIMPGEEPADVFWSIRPQDTEYATINQKGKLTARAVTAAHQIEVTAQPKNGTEQATLMVWVLPRTTGLCIMEGNSDVSGTELDVDMALISSMQFTAESQPEGAMDNLIWRSSNEDVASVDDGLVTFNAPGTVTVSVLADDGSGKSASVKINVTYRDTANILTATVDAPDNVLQAGERAQMRVYGADPVTPLDIATLQFGIPESQRHIATVDSTGLITAGETPGSVTVTASLKGDPLGRRVTVKLTVIARQTERLVLRTDAPEPAEVQMMDADGYRTNDEARADRYCVLLRKADVEGSAYSFLITPEAFNSAGSSNPGSAGLKWASSNSKIAAVSVNEDGTALVTVKRGAVGACVISAVTTDAAKAENELSVHIRDYSPKLETYQPVLNTYLTHAAVVGLVPSYDNDITDVVLLENDKQSERLIPSYEDGLLTISAQEYIPNGTWDLVLNVTCSDGWTYSYPLSAKVKNTASRITVSQQNKMDLFYTDSTAVLTLSAENEQILDVELKDTADFALVEFDAASGEAVLQFSDDYILDHSEKADTKATLLVYLKDYSQPVEASVSIATQNKKPAVQTSVKFSTINTAVSEEKTASFGFVLKGSTELLPLDRAEYSVVADFAEGWIQNDQMVLTLTGTSGGTATILLQLDNWMEPVKLTHKVNVTDKAPTLKFGKDLLNLNSVFTEQTDSTAALLSQSNLTISDISMEPVAKPNTSLRTEADKLTVSYDPYTGMITAQITDPENAPKPGVYAFAAQASVLDGRALSAVMLKVRVSASVPTVRLKNSTLKLNRILCGEETARAEVIMNGEDRYSLVGFDYPDGWAQDSIPLDLNYEDGQLTAMLLDDNTDTQTYPVKLLPIVLDALTGQEQTLSSTVNVRVTVYSKESIGVSLSAAGMLDTIRPDSEIRYTVTKITNACGTIDGVSMEGPDANLFDIQLNGDGTVSLKLLPGEEYSTRTVYKVQFCFLICGRNVTSNLLSFRVYQSVLRFSMAAASCILYQSQTMPLTVRLTLDSPEGAILETITLDGKSDAAFLNAMNGGEMDVEIANDGRSAEITFDVRNAASLASGKTYALYLNAAAQGSASDAKVNQVKITVRVK